MAPAEAGNCTITLANANRSKGRVNPGKTNLDGKIREGWAAE